MAVVQDAFFIPDDIATGLATGLYRRIGSVVRYATDSEILRHSCGYLTDCSESCNHFCVSAASVVKGLIHCVHLAFCRSLCFALHYSMEVRRPFGRKNTKIF